MNPNKTINSGRLSLPALSRSLSMRVASNPGVSSSSMSSAQVRNSDEQIETGSRDVHKRPEPIIEKEMRDLKEATLRYLKSHPPASSDSILKFYDPSKECFTDWNRWVSNPKSHLTAISADDTQGDLERFLLMVKIKSLNTKMPHISPAHSFFSAQQPPPFSLRTMRAPSGTPVAHSHNPTSRFHHPTDPQAPPNFSSLSQGQSRTPTMQPSAPRMQPPGSTMPSPDPRMQPIPPRIPRVQPFTQPAQPVPSCNQITLTRAMRGSSSKPSPGGIYNENGKKVLVMRSDGLCFFRAVMCQSSISYPHLNPRVNPHLYATCSEIKLKQDFMRLYSLKFNECMNKLEQQLLSIIDMKHADSLKCIKQTLIMMKSDWKYIYNTDRLLVFLQCSFPEIAPDEIKQNLILISDAGFDILISTFNCPNLKLKDKHYNLYLN